VIGGCLGREVCGVVKDDDDGDDDDDVDDDDDDDGDDADAENREEFAEEGSVMGKVTWSGKGGPGHGLVMLMKGRGAGRTRVSSMEWRVSGVDWGGSNLKNDLGCCMFSNWLVSSSRLCSSFLFALRF
jgi:hypothetical protein